MTPETLARLHARAFTGLPRPWTAAEFADFLALPATRLFQIATDGEPRAFALARRAGPEVEVLTLCTDPAHRRAGHAAALVQDLMDWARGAGAEEIFLEVAESNAAARALYARAGFVSRGFRRDYYTAQGQISDHALVLSRTLSETGTKTGTETGSRP